MDIVFCIPRTEDTVGEFFRSLGFFLAAARNSNGLMCRQALRTADARRIYVDDRDRSEMEMTAGAGEIYGNVLARHASMATIPTGNFVVESATTSPER